MRAVARTLAALVLVLGAGSTALADKWGTPGENAFFSRGREYRLTVFPRILSSAGDYWHTYDLGPGKRGQAQGKRDVCLGQLERRAADGSYALVWKREMVNDVSPLSALVTRDGHNVVTFDNWHRMGYGKDTVVIYGPGGELKASLALDDFLTAEQLGRLFRSVSSIHWGGTHRFDEAEGRVVLEIVKRPDEGNLARPWLNVSLSLASPRQDLRVTPAGPRSGIDALFQAKPEIDWSATSKVIADVDCDGQSDQAFLGRAGGRIYVGVVLSGHAMLQVLDFALGGREQAAICSEPAVLTSEDLEDPAAKRCKGLRLEGGDCDSIHLSWEGDRLTWSRN